MDLKQTEYIVKIAEEKNITRAAEKLFLTQPALNQQLIRLEKELGTQIFIRSRTNWRSTAAGEVYLESARELLRIQHETYNKIQDIIKSQKGHLSIGLTPTRGTNMFSEIYPDFHCLYPDFMIEPSEIPTRTQQDMIKTGNLDLGFVTLSPEQKTSDNYIKLCTEELMLAVPKKLANDKELGPTGGQITISELVKFVNEPFVLIYNTSTLRPLINNLFHEVGFSPIILFETSNTNTIIKMINSSICCGIVPKYHKNENHPNVAYYSIVPKLTWEISATYRKGSYLTEAAKTFIKLAKEYWLHETE